MSLHTPQKTHKYTKTELHIYRNVFAHIYMHKATFMYLFLYYYVCFNTSINKVIHLRCFIYEYMG